MGEGASNSPPHVLSIPAGLHHPEHYQCVVICKGSSISSFHFKATNIRRARKTNARARTKSTATSSLLRCRSGDPNLYHRHSLHVACANVQSYKTLSHGTNVGWKRKSGRVGSPLHRYAGNVLQRGSVPSSCRQGDSRAMETRFAYSHLASICPVWKYEPSRIAWSEHRVLRQYCPFSSGSERDSINLQNG